MSRRRKSADQSEHKTAVTLEDVAKAAGVTPMTVSRAIKGAGHVSPATRKKVLRVVEEFNYTVNTAARTLATGQTGVIAVLCGSSEPIYYSNMVRLLDAQLTASGYQMRLLQTKSELQDLINATKSSAVDGVIASWMHSLSEEPDFRASQFFHRCVFLDTTEHPNTDYVRIDLRGAVQDAFEHMIAVGRKRIAYVGTSEPTVFDPSSAIGDRLLTYIAVMEKSGMALEYISSPARLNQTERIQRLREYFEANGCPDGIFCLRDEIAILVYRALRDCGYKIPEDVLLTGCDGLPIMECFDPPLSAVVQPLEEACALAWNFLKARITIPETPLQQATLQAKLALRGSMLPEGWEPQTLSESEGVHKEGAFESDISDAQWLRVEPLLRLSTGRKAQIDRRSVVNAILYVAHTGCQWRQLPPEFPNWSTVYSCYHRWLASGVLHSIYAITGVTN
ncbi:LacI family DNA-binding transcriptional regulator [bacterium]|nr:MAG: LacI family DNA-binding transcriptional regulator [bacterium]